MKNNIDAPKAKLSRHAHNISAGYSSSMTTGAIIPQYFDVLQPGDTIYYTPKMFLRLRDVVTAFLGEVNVNIDCFFVPMQMLYLPFGQIFAQTNDVISSVFYNLTGRDSFPRLSMADTFTDEVLKDVKKQSFCGENVVKGMIRLADALDCEPLAFASIFEQGITSTGLYAASDIYPWAFAAYQAIYQKYYRNEVFEQLNVPSYNLDAHYGVDKFSMVELFRLRFCQRPNDYFTNVRVGPLGSALNRIGFAQGTIDSSGGSFLSQLTKVNDYLGFESKAYGFGLNVTNGLGAENYNEGYEASSADTTTTYQANDYYPTAANIRTLFAVDKFLRIYGRAGKTYDEQILAHFGVKVPHDVKHDLTHLCNYRTSLMAEPIYSTSTNNDGSVLGQVGGQGSAKIEGKRNKFTAPVHGIFMCVAYANVKPKYFGTFSKLHLLGDRLAFPIPEFDKLGAQPLYAYECYPSNVVISRNEGDDEDGIYLNSQRIGWQNRYQQFKQKYNRVSLGFANSRDVIGFDDAPQNNVWSPWVLSRTPFERSLPEYSTTKVNDSMSVSAYELYERADTLNSVMAIEYNGNLLNNGAMSSAIWNLFSTDPILSEFYMDAKKVSWMSPTGDPDL